jgi:Flp pilus assembly protein TadB
MNVFLVWCFFIVYIYESEEKNDTLNVKNKKSKRIRRIEKKISAASDKKEVAEKKANYQQHRAKERNEFKHMSKKNQPIMKYRMEKMLKKIKESTN